jgi:DNA-directed RNA polymerase subunit RPC12/RpoP
MLNTYELNYQQSITKTYWCHLCKKEFNKIFIENLDIQCRYCGNNFCEELNIQNESDHPQNFVPYESENSRNNPLNSNLPYSSTRNSGSILDSLTNRDRRPRTTSSLLDMIFGLLRDRNTEESNMESIINMIMANDDNRYGNPPASKEALNALEKVKIDEENLKEIRKNSNCENCSVCKDDFDLDQQIVNLPCKHSFHEDCLTPWLTERNSCPTCRFELPTDDPDYEARKNSL